MRILTIVALLASLSSVWSQGAGVVGSNGLEPELSFVGVTVGSLTHVMVHDLVPAATPTLVLIIGTDTASVQLPATLPGGVLGIDPTPPAPGFFFVTPPFPVPASGDFDLSFAAPPSFAGMTLYFQALNLNPMGTALSDAAPITFGFTNERVVASIGPGDEAQELVEYFADGLLMGSTLPQLGEFEVKSVDLTASLGTMALATEIPILDETDDDRPRILLPGGAALYHYDREVSDREGFLVVRPGQSHAESLIEGAAEWHSRVAASMFGPLVAVMAEAPLPEFGGSTLFLLRTDGTNWSGSASPVHPIPVGTVNPISSSLTFLSDALFWTDGQTLMRCPTDGVSAPAVVPLPVSGGATPVSVDGEFAWSRDGRALAFTAGASAVMRDVYVVSNLGTAINVTDSAGMYRAVGYDQPITMRHRLALAPDGSRVAYVRESGSDEDLFIQETGIAGAFTGALPVNMTPNFIFAPDIEAQAGIWMVSPDRVVFHAGHLIDAKDIYSAHLSRGIPGPILVSNVSNSSGTPGWPSGIPSSVSGVNGAALEGIETEAGIWMVTTGPVDPANLTVVIIDPSRAPVVSNSFGSTGCPFGVSSSLDVRNVALLDDGGIIYELGAGPGQPSCFIGVLDSMGEPVAVLSDVDSIIAALPSGAGPVIGYTSGGSSHVDLIMSPGVTSLYSGTLALAPTAILADPLTGRALAAVPSGTQEILMLLAPSNAPIPIAGVVASEIRKTCAFLPSGNILVPVEAQLPSGDATTIFAVNPVTQTGIPLATVPGVLIYY